MLGRRWGTTLAAAAVVVATLVASPAPADEVRALNLEVVAEVPVQESTHFEFMTREIAGVERTFVLLGAREVSTTPPGGTPDGGLHVIDVTDPENPVKVAHIPCRTTSNDVAVVPVDHVINGVAYNAIIGLASNSGTGCTHAGGTGAVRFIGVREEPRVGEVLSVDGLGANTIDPRTGFKYAWGGQAAHTLVAHPIEPLLYVASQDYPDQFPSVEIVDLATWPPAVKSVPLPLTGLVPPESPRQEPGVLINPHDITFRPDGERAYSSHLDISTVLDTTDPRSPKPIGVIASPNLKIHHEATLHPDGRHLFVIDEFVNVSSRTTNVGQCPGGGVHIFDLGPNHEFETAPVPVGQFYAPDISTPAIADAAADGNTDIGCTAHEYNFSPDGRWMPIGWTGAGARAIDLSTVLAAAAVPVPTPVAPLEIGHYHETDLVGPDLWPDDIWAAKVHPNLPGYVFTSNTQAQRADDGTIHGGLRVLRCTGDLAAFCAAAS